MINGKVTWQGRWSRVVEGINEETEEKLTVLEVRGAPDALGNLRWLDPRSDTIAELTMRNALAELAQAISHKGGETALPAQVMENVTTAPGPGIETNGYASTNIAAAQNAKAQIPRKRAAS